MELLIYTLFAIVGLSLLVFLVDGIKWASAPWGKPITLKATVLSTAGPLNAPMVEPTEVIPYTWFVTLKVDQATWTVDDPQMFNSVKAGDEVIITFREKKLNESVIRDLISWKKA